MNIHKLLLVTELNFCNNPKDNGNILCAFFFLRNQGDGNFQVGLKIVIPAALNGQTHALDIHHVKQQFALQLFPPMRFHLKNPAYAQLLPKSSSMHINIRR